MAGQAAEFTGVGRVLWWEGINITATALNFDRIAIKLFKSWVDTAVKKTL